jgi:8-oxo-dGTP pyrophosphatase MutT (NUDIX family)
MEQNYKIYHNDKVVFLKGNDSDNFSIDGEVVFNVQTETELQQSLAKFIATTGPKTTIIESNCTSDALFKMFKKQFKVIHASGGLVQNNLGEYLFIFRRGKWDLPKGKLDRGETFQEAAVREVMEETGIKNVEITGIFGKTWHIFPLKNRMALKLTRWYHMFSTSTEELIPQTEEDIVEVKWLDANAARKIIDQTHSSVGDLLSGFLKF